MEGSGKWPHDRLAIRHIRAAFQIQLAELLKKHHNYTCKPCPTHLDVWKVVIFKVVAHQRLIYILVFCFLSSKRLACQYCLFFENISWLPFAFRMVLCFEFKWRTIASHRFCGRVWMLTGCWWSGTMRRLRLWRWSLFTNLYLPVHYMGKYTKMFSETAEFWCFSVWFVVNLWPLLLFYYYFFLSLFCWFISCCLLFLLVSSSSTRLSVQFVAWLNAGWRLSSSMMTSQRTQQICWWHRSSCSPHPLLLQGNSKLNHFKESHVFPDALFCSVGHVNCVSPSFSALLRWASCVSLFCSHALTGGTTRW